MQLILTSSCDPSADRGTSSSSGLRIKGPSSRLEGSAARGAEDMAVGRDG